MYIHYNCMCIYTLYVYIYIRYYNGNDQEEGQVRGFGHTGFLVDDLIQACTYLESQGNNYFIIYK